MPVSNPELWKRIEGYHFPKPAPVRRWQTKIDSFEAKLASEMALSDENAARLVLEYRKFLYLKAVDGGLLSPPPDVDDVWHKHIEAPEGAWVSFCQTVIGHRLEHRTGLSTDDARAARSKVNALYQQEFGPPPKDIWPGPNEDWRYSVGSAVTSLGLVIFFGSMIVAGATTKLGDPLPSGWFPLTFLLGVLMIPLGAFVAWETRLKRESSCG